MTDHFDVYTHRDMLVVKVRAEKLDFFVISESSAYLRSLFEDRHYPSTIFDLTGVSIIDSSAFGFFIEIRNEMVKQGRDLVIVCSDADILHIISMLNVSRIIRIFPDIDRAADSLQGR